MSKEIRVKVKCWRCEALFYREGIFSHARRKHRVAYENYWFAKKLPEMKERKIRGPQPITYDLLGKVIG